MLGFLILSWSKVRRLTTKALRHEENHKGEIRIKGFYTKARREAKGIRGREQVLEEDGPEDGGILYLRFGMTLVQQDDGLLL
jgi:hypothetical protein